MAANVYFMRAEAALDGISSENAADMLQLAVQTSIAYVSFKIPNLFILKLQKKVI